jgi:hypothetical protein
MNTTLRLRTFSSLQDLLGYAMYNIALPTVFAFICFALMNSILTELGLHGPTVHFEEFTWRGWIVFLIGIVDGLVAMIMSFWVIAGAFTFFLGLLGSIPRFVSWLVSGGSR